MPLNFAPYDPSFPAALKAGGTDANGLPAERAVSPGTGAPCRTCLDIVPEGAEMLVAAARPFAQLHPYAELGPVFFCAHNCTPWQGAGVPPVLTASPSYLLKAYGRDERIIYGTGQITQQAEVESTAAALLSREDVAYVDVRSAKNNCFLTRITEVP